MPEIDVFSNTPMNISDKCRYDGQCRGKSRGVTRVTSNPPGAAAYFMILLCVKAIYTFLIMPTS